LHLNASRQEGVYVPEVEEISELEDEFPELGEEQENLVSMAFVPSPQDEILVSAFSINITRRDIQTLNRLNWLNDEIINFYMNLICERSQNKSANHASDYLDLSCYAFSTFFYPKLLKDGYGSLKRWTRKVDLFTYNLILIPIHLGLHWTLAVIDFNCEEIRYYDSMNGNNNECLKVLKY
jgi:sentrin-specific protease 1